MLSWGQIERSNGRKNETEMKSQKERRDRREGKKQPTDTLSLLRVCVFVSLSFSLPHTVTHIHRDVPNQPHHWDKSHIDIDKDILRGSDIKTHREKLQLEILLPFKD